MTTLLLWMVINTVFPIALAAPRSTEPDSAIKAIIHKRTRNFIDIEVPVEQTWVGCSDNDSKEPRSLMLFYALDEGESHEFHYRRMYDVPTCMKIERDYQKLLKGAKTVRLVGHHSIPAQGPKPSVSQRVPGRFTQRPKIVWWTFSRLQADGQCKAYFPSDCDLPKNYWVGVIPE